MASKTVSLSEATYDRLAREKGQGESFSDVIDRLLEARDSEHPLHGLIGLGGEAELESVRGRSDAFRGSVEERIGRDP